MLLSHGSAGRRYEVARDTASIVVIDRQVLTRGCLVEILRSEFPDLDLIGLAASTDLEEIKGRSVRLAILNIESSPITDASALQDLSALKRAFPGTPIAVMSQRDDEAVISQAIQRGVKCYLPTSLPLEIAVAAIRLALVGGIYYPRQIALEPSGSGAALSSGSSCGSVIEPSAHTLGMTVGQEPHTTAPAPADGVGGLTRREVEVLAALQRGRSNKLIACELGMSENTVKVHIQRIMRKLRASNRTEAVLISQQRLSGTALSSPTVS